MKNKKAFTFVELLVVIAIIGMLVAILLPAINKAREAIHGKSPSVKASLQPVELQLPDDYAGMIGSSVACMGDSWVNKIVSCTYVTKNQETATVFFAPIDFSGKQDKVVWKLPASLEKQE